MLWYDEYIERYTHHCGGAIINRRQIVSAAHCFQEEKANVETWIVLAGVTDIYIPKLYELGYNRTAVGKLPNVYLPEEIISHGGFRPTGFVNDIAIINLKEPLKFGREINSIKLARRPPKGM